MTACKPKTTPSGRPYEDGMIIHTGVAIVVRNGKERFYWFEIPEGYGEKPLPPPGATLHGPFKTEAELHHHEELTLLGPDCQVTDGGMWDPAWEKPQ
jgi:hypothetical protein